MPTLSFDVRIDRAGHLIVLARRFYDVWWLYVGVDTRAAILDSMNRFPEFFRFDEHAHFVSLVTHLASLFERRSDTINFESLVDEAEVNNLMPANFIAEARAALDSVAHIRPKVAILRSNTFAHRSASLSYEDAFRKAAFTPNQLRDMTVAGLSIANALLAGRGLGPVLFTKSTAEHTRGMLRALDECS
jgi:hypothetical protein